jgi:hypothetical protein
MNKSVHFCVLKLLWTFFFLFAESDGYQTVAELIEERKPNNDHNREREKHIKYERTKRRTDYFSELFWSLLAQEIDIYPYSFKISLPLIFCQSQRHKID